MSESRLGFYLELAREETKRQAGIAGYWQEAYLQERNKRIELEEQLLEQELSHE